MKTVSSQHSKTPILENASPVLGMKQKRGWYAFWWFFKISLRSAISFERSRRELSIGVAEHRSTLKSYQNTHYPRFRFIPKTGIAFPYTGVCFHCAWLGLELVPKNQHSPRTLVRFALGLGSGSCHKRQKPQAPTPQAQIRNRQTRNVVNAKGLNRNTNLT